MNRAARRCVCIRGNYAKRNSKNPLAIWRIRALRQRPARVQRNPFVIAPRARGKWMEIRKRDRPSLRSTHTHSYVFPHRINVVVVVVVVVVAFLSRLALKSCEDNEEEGEEEKEDDLAMGTMILRRNCAMSLYPAAHAVVNANDRPQLSHTDNANTPWASAAAFSSRIARLSPRV